MKVLTFSRWKWDTSSPKKESETKGRYILTAVVYRCIWEDHAVKVRSAARWTVKAPRIDYVGCWQKQSRVFTVPHTCWQSAQPTHWVTFTVQACWNFYSHRPAGLLTTGTAYGLGNVHSPGLLTFLLSSSSRPVDNWHSLHTGKRSQSRPVDIFTLIVPQACWHFYSHRPAGLLTNTVCALADYQSVQASCWQKQWKLLTVPYAC